MSGLTNRLYLGRVMHMRLRPKAHQFRYRVFSLLLDIDALDAAAAKTRLLRINRFGLFSFMEKDHGARDGSPLRGWVDEVLAERGLARPERVMLLSFPRVLGYAFNPISVYLCHDGAGRLQSVIYEVKNTFGDQIAYALPCDGAAVEHHECGKGMYVSPFIDMDQTYRFALRASGDAFALRIKQGAGAGDTLIATHNAEAVGLSDGALLRVLITHPLMTLKVLAGIHIEAFRLFAKGLKFNRYSRSETWAKRMPAE